MASDRLAPVRLYWAERTAREQLILASLVALLVVVVAWYGVLSPALSWRAEARESHARAVASFETMVSGVARYRAEAEAANRPQSGTALRTLVGNSASQRQLAISRVQPLEDGRLGVWMEAVSDEALMAWLLSLAREEGVRVDQISLDRDGEGLVRTQMVLVRGGAS